MLALRHLPSTLRARHTLAARSTLTRIRCYSTKPEILDSELPKPRLDYKGIVENTVSKAHNAAKRNAPLPVGAVESVGDLYTEWKQISGDLNERRHMRSSLGNKIRQSAKDPAAKQAALEHAKTLKAQVTQLEAQVSDVEDRLLELALGIPNDTHPLSPIGPESAAITLSTHGPSPIPADPKRDHVSVGKALGMLDLEAGAMVTGSSWYYLINDGALLELALTNYALSIATKHGFKPVLAPDVVRADIARRCGFQPRDANGSQMYHIADSNPELVLSGTAEIPLAGLFANRILPPDQVPTKLVGLGRAFRAEAGARGADTRGLYRVHQFSKLELFVCCQGEVATSEKLMEEMRRIQIEIFKGLEIPFRVLDMPTEELGASAYRKFDMEAWMPGRGSWGEISSSSNCTDYQARRLHIRYRPIADATGTVPGGVPFAHTLNGTAAAIPRLIVALLENGVQFAPGGSISSLDLPSALRPFWPGSIDNTRIRWL